MNEEMEYLVICMKSHTVKKKGKFIESPDHFDYYNRMDTICAEMDNYLLIPLISFNRLIAFDLETGTEVQGEYHHHIYLTTISTNNLAHKLNMMSVCTFVHRVSSSELVLILGCRIQHNSLDEVADPSVLRIVNKTSTLITANLSCSMLEIYIPPVSYDNSALVVIHKDVLFIDLKNKEDISIKRYNCKDIDRCISLSHDKSTGKTYILTQTNNTYKIGTLSLPTDPSKPQFSAEEIMVLEEGAIPMNLCVSGNSCLIVTCKFGCLYVCVMHNFEETNEYKMYDMCMYAVRNSGVFDARVTAEGKVSVRMYAIGFDEYCMYMHLMYQVYRGVVAIEDIHDVSRMLV